ncbi:MAG TPA: alpha/beta hydrolase [Ktedonobacterales bacterium]|jgi:pimeloyl-ACP methyl ester carboxylesterase
MQSTDQINASAAVALEERQQDSALFVATCRAHPHSANLYDALPLDAGDYQVAWAYPAEAAGKIPMSFTYGRWKTISHREPPDDVAALLPTGDVLVVVHGFNETAPEGVYTGQKISARLAPQKRTGSIKAALGGHKGASLPGALRLAQSLQNRLSTPAEADAEKPLYQQLIAFTWPCDHRVWPGYLLDKEEVARFAAFSLANLLADLRAAQPDRRILLVGHSMGCFLTIKALNILSVLRSAQAGSGASSVIVDQMVFYAPDLNTDALQSDPPPRGAADTDLSDTLVARRRNGYGFQALDRVGRLTIYYSFHDNILIWSPFANFFTEESSGGAGRARLGWCGPYNIKTVHKNVVAVDCSACIYDHSAYFIRHEVLKHTIETLAGPIPAAPQHARQAAPLQTTQEGAQQAAERLWTWYTPAEIAREWWERFFLYKSRWVRRLAVALGLLLTLAIIAGVIFGLVKLVFGV